MSEPAKLIEAELSAAPEIPASAPAARPAKTIAAAPAPAEEPPSQTEAVIDSIAASEQQALQTLETASATMLESVARVQLRIAEFVSERIRQDMETQQEFLRCKSFDEVCGVQARFFRTAVNQYSEEASNLLRLGGEAMSRVVERVD